MFAALLLKVGVMCSVAAGMETDAPVRQMVSPVELSAPLFPRRVTVNQPIVPQLPRPLVDQESRAKCPVLVAITLRRGGKPWPVTGPVRGHATMKGLWPKPN
jgi:hypothetical protein